MRPDVEEAKVVIQTSDGEMPGFFTVLHLTTFWTRGVATATP